MTVALRRRKGGPYGNQLRLPDGWGQRMTLCIAGMNQRSGCIIAVSDFMMSEESSSTEPNTVKAQWVPHAPSWVQMFAGDLTVDERVSQYVYEHMAPGSPALFQKILSHFHDAYRIELCRRIEMEILAPLGMTREDFLQHGRAYFGDAEFLGWLARIENATLGTTFLVAGIEPSGSMRMFSLENPGVSRYWDRLGFHAIGTGAGVAIATLHRTYKAALPLEDMIYRLCEAKFLGEVAQGVGKTTMVQVVMANGTCRVMRPPDVEALRTLWVGTPPVPDVAKAEIEKRLKPEPEWGQDSA
jgi:hypothetical protein